MGVKSPIPEGCTFSLLLIIIITVEEREKRAHPPKAAERRRKKKEKKKTFVLWRMRENRKSLSQGRARAEDDLYLLGDEKEEEDMLIMAIKARLATRSLLASTNFCCLRLF